jgi:SPP1 family predicted phage head-tail adaptor
MIAAGTMTERIELLAPVVERGHAGEQVVTYEVERSTWAAVTYQKGSRAIAQGDVYLSSQVVVTTRYQEGITERHRIRWNGKVYRIVSFNGKKTDGSMTIIAEYIEEGML